MSEAASIAAHAIPASITVVAGLFVIEDLLMFERDRTVVPAEVAVKVDRCAWTSMSDARCATTKMYDAGRVIAG